MVYTCRLYRCLWFFKLTMAAELILAIMALAALNTLIAEARTGCHVPKSADKHGNVTHIGPRATPSLQLVFIYTRHGSRGPKDDYPTLPHPLSDVNIWPYGRAQLTMGGRAQVYSLGAKIRSLYDGFLSEVYCDNDLKAYSTLTDRTLMSAELFLAGLYPPLEYQVWNYKISWQPVPVFPSLDRSQIFLNQELCPRFQKEYKQSMSDYDREFAQNITAVMKYVQPYTGLSVDNETVSSLRNSMDELWEALLRSEDEGLPLPDWTEKIFRTPLENLMKKLFVATTSGSDEMIRLYQGMLFQNMMSLMEAKLNGTLSPDRRMFLFSGHDTSLLGLQAILGTLDDDSGHMAVNTGSALIFELHKDPITGQAYVEVIYIDGGSPDLEPEDVNIPSCAFPCDFTQLKNITEKYYINNFTEWKHECKVLI